MHARVNLSLRQQLSQIYSELRGSGRGSGDGSTAKADAVTLGDSWLAPAIVNGLIAPIPRADAAPWLARLPAGWHRLLRRCPKSGEVVAHGDIWGVPYRWGCTLMAMRDDVPETTGVTDWHHLWDAKLRRRVGCTSASREILAIVLRSLGASPNTPDCSRLPPGVRQQDVADRLRAFLAEQVLTLDDTHMLKSLACKDIWVAVGNSQDVLAFALRTPHIRVIAPASGTQLWADMWTLPMSRAADPSPLLQQWYEFTTSPARANPAQGLKVRRVHWRRIKASHLTRNSCGRLAHRRSCLLQLTHHCRHGLWFPGQGMRPAAGSFPPHACLAQMSSRGRSSCSHLHQLAGRSTAACLTA